MKPRKSIWLIDPYSEIPKEGWRHGRYYLIAKALSDNGYEVRLFISNYSHKDKILIDSTQDIQINPNFNISVVSTIGYKSHISFERIKYEKLFAKNISDNKKKYDLPAYIILKEPAIFMYNNLKPLFELSKAKIIIDIMDLWPELFALKISKKLRWLGQFLFYPFYLKRNFIIKSASALTAVSPDYLEVGLKINNKVPSEVVYWGCDVSSINSIVNSDSGDFLLNLNLSKQKNEIWGIYAGTLGESYDIKTLLKAAECMKNDYPQLKFLIAGAGPLAELVKETSLFEGNIIFLGSLPTNQLYQLFKFCDFGFSSYTDASPVSMPIKCYDYFAAGLPLVNSLKRNLALLIKEYDLGYQYNASDYFSLVKVLKEIMKAPENLIHKKINCQKLSLKFDDKIQYNKFVLLLNKMEK